MAKEVEIPVGFRFSPSDEQLIMHYLLMRLRGEIFDLVKDCDLYASHEPWKLFDKNAQKVFYVFAKLTKNGKMTKRTAGSGTWNHQNSGSVFDRDGRVIGTRKMFRFEDKKSAATKKNNNGVWIMHELSVPQSDDVVVCRIRNKDLDRADKIEINPCSNSKKRTHDFVIINANPSKFVKLQADNVINIPHPEADNHDRGSNSASMDMIRDESIQDRPNLSFTKLLGVEPAPVVEQPAPLMDGDVAAADEGKIVEYDAYRVQEHQNFSSTEIEPSMIELLVGEQLAPLVDGDDAAANGGQVVEYHDIMFSENELFGEEYTPLTDVSAAGSEEKVENKQITHEDQGYVGEQSAPLMMDVAANEEKLEYGQITHNVGEQFATLMMDIDVAANEGKLKYGHDVGEQFAPLMMDVVAEYEGKLEYGQITHDVGAQFAPLMMDVVAANEGKAKYEQIARNAEEYRNCKDMISYSQYLDQVPMDWLNFYALDNFYDYMPK